MNLGRMKPLIMVGCIGMLLLASCTEPIDWEPAFERKPVVNCVLDGSTSVQTLSLTYNNLPGNPYFERIDDARITLYAGDEPVGDFQPDGYGDWQLRYHPTRGQAYRLEVEIDGYPLLEATTTMPGKVPVVYRENVDESAPIHTYFRQESYAFPYWAFVLRREGEGNQPSQEDRLLTSVGTNHPACDRFNESGSMMSASYGNAYRTAEQVGYLRMVPEAEVAYDFYIEAPAGRGWYCFRAVSPEYDAYLKSSIQKMLVYSSFDDPSSWFDENEVYSNIQNGLGIFGACQDVWFKTGF